MKKRKSGKRLIGLDDLHGFDNNNITYSDDDILIISSLKEMTETAAIRIGMNVITICAKGRVQLDINGKTYVIDENQLLISPAGTTIENILMSPDAECKIICMTNKILQTFLGQYISVWNQAMFFNELKVREVEVKERLISQKMHELLSFFLGLEEFEYKKVIIQSLMQAMLLGLCAVLDMSIGKEEKRSTMLSGSTFRNFLDLLSKEGTKRHSVSYYADKLCVTPKYLSLLCSKNSMKTAKQWIDEYTMENVRFYLRSTDKSMKEIAAILDFPNASYFGRYVKDHFGMSPMDYRRGVLREG